MKGNLPVFFFGFTNALYYVISLFQFTSYFNDIQVLVD